MEADWRKLTEALIVTAQNTVSNKQRTERWRSMPQDIREIMEKRRRCNKRFDETDEESYTRSDSKEKKVEDHGKRWRKSKRIQERERYEENYLGSENDSEKNHRNEKKNLLILC